MPFDNPSSFGRDDETHPLRYDDRHLANVATALSQERHPRQIGTYRIVETIGEGGMGTVYRAEQTKPIQRSVAIKVIKLGMDSRAVLSRFESERDALAVMDHPHVARVLDAGTTDAGRPYFVMELVDGTPITTYADEHRASVRDRLLLMTQACEAVQHAHQKAIIHRDIKPSNILVAHCGGTPVVKVIDFGVAKAIDRSGSDRAAPVTAPTTEVGQMVGTPEYMSPEQADGERDVDTRSDVYSLGVVLYELLSGVLPFDSKSLRQGGYGEACRIIREVDPPKPSARLSSLGAESSTVAERRGSSPALLAQQLRSELDWIVVKSLRKDREGRYASPAEMAQDIANYLADRPLRAGPESVVYRVRKFARRNKAGVIGAGVAATLLLTGVSATSWQAVRAIRAEHATRAENRRAEEALSNAESANTATASVNAFLIDMLRSVDPEYAKGKPVLVRDLIDRAAAEVGAKFKDLPKVEAEVRTTLGLTYAALGLNDKADEHLTAAWHLRQRIAGEDAADTLQAKQRVASLRIAQERFDEAYAMTNEVLARARALYGPAAKVTRDSAVELAVISDRRGDAAEAERLFRESLAADEKAGLRDTPEHFVTVGNLGQMLRFSGRLDESETLCREAYENIVRLKGDDDPVAIDMHGTYGDVLRLRRKYPEAEAAMRDYLARSLKVLGPNRISSINAEQGLAIVLQSEGKADEALPHFRNALAQMRVLAGDDSGETLMQVMSLAAARANVGDHDEASKLFEEAYEGWNRTAGPDHPFTVTSRAGGVQNLLLVGKWAEALAPAKAIYEQLQDPKRVQISADRRARFLSAYGIVLAQLERPDDAVGPLVFAHDALAGIDMRERMNFDAYGSVMRALTAIASEKGDAVELAKWQQEAHRFDATTRPATVPAIGLAP